jgi:3-oxoadipate enol-lactonase
MVLALLLLLFADKVYVQSQGTAPNTIVFVHGWAADHTFFDKQYEDFSKTHRVISFDLPGHGQSAIAEPANMDSYVKALNDLRLQTKTTKWILVGHALGGLIAREYARRYPQQTQALILLDGSIFQLPPGATDRSRWAENITNMARNFGPGQERQVRERNISVFLSNLYTDSTPRELQMNILRKILSTKPQTAESALVAMADLNLWKEEPLPIPVLALRAGRQQPPNDEAYLKTLFPRLQYKFLPGLSHFLMMEAPAQVNTEIHEFLKGRKLQ